LLCGYDPESPAEKILIMSWSMCVTKQGLGTVVPAAGIVVGGALNWAILEGIVDAADLAYRRRSFLICTPLG
jgi:hypothetical protein